MGHRRDRGDRQGEVCILMVEVLKPEDQNRMEGQIQDSSRETARLSADYHRVACPQGSDRPQWRWMAAEDHPSHDSKDQNPPHSRCPGLARSVR